jgi:hypothetical protein
MAQTTFSGPVKSLNGFIGGTSTDPISVTTAQNISSSYGTTSAATGDTRLNYSKLTFTSTGSGETLRAYSVVTGAGAAAGGTINGAHISLSINGSGTISGAGNALRVTLGGTSTNPGGTIASLQVDSGFCVWWHLDECFVYPFHEQRYGYGCEPDECPDCDGARRCSGYAY